MTSKIGTLVQQQTTGTGTGNLTLTTVNGKRSFDTQFSHGSTTDVFYYFISHQTAAEWEYGTGHMSDATTFVRDTVTASSNANSAVNFSAGTKDVVNDLPAAIQAAVENLSGVNTGDQTSVAGNAGTATALATARAIYGNNFDGTTALTQIIASTYGGTGNGFAKLSGPASTEKTFTLPNASAAILTDNAAVTVAQGGTGLGTLTLNNVILGNGTSTPQFVAPGASGHILTSNGTTWSSSAAAAAATTLPLNTGTASINVQASDQGKMVQLTGSTARTFTLLNAATVGTNWWCYINNASTAILTLATTSSETVDGLTTFPIYPSEIRLIRSDGSSAFTSYVVHGFRYPITATGNTTFTAPPGYAAFYVELWGAGGSGGCSTSTSNRGGGGGGGAYATILASAAAVGSSVTVGIGAGGASVATSSNGNFGGNSTFGSLLTAYGGGGGAGTAQIGPGGGGGGQGAVGVSGAGIATAAGGRGNTTHVACAGGAAGTPGGDGSIDSGAGGGAAGAVGGNAYFGGAGGGGAISNTAATGQVGGNSIYGGGGGGAAAGTGTISARSTSVFGGFGGKGGNNTTAGEAGQQPAGGGGGGANSVGSGKGGDGQCVIYGEI